MTGCAGGGSRNKLQNPLIRAEQAGERRAGGAAAEEGRWDSMDEHWRKRRAGQGVGFGKVSGSGQVELAVGVDIAAADGGGGADDEDDGEDGGSGGAPGARRSHIACSQETRIRSEAPHRLPRHLSVPG